ncbi:MAG: murein biosynthesis integral membrane protein MurJ [Armatimonadota bacterium]|nr:murein biosynthesis integral membrane protein MurJ [Armatimonadota bacterium]
MATAPKAIPRERSLQISTTMTVGRASLLLGAMIGLSRLTGFGRVMLTSYLYGISPETDAYNYAFNIPDTISILIAGGALATGFVPVFTEYLARGQEDAARHTFRAMFTLIGVTFSLLTVLLFALTYTPAGLLLAPQKLSAEYVQLYLYLLRILLIAQFFFVLGGMFSGTLNALRLFWYAALQPVVFNCGIIIFGIALPHFFGMGIESQAWGALIGAFIGSMLIQIPGILRHGLSLRPLWDLKDPGVRRVVRAVLPIFFGLASGQIIAMILPRFFAGGLELGDVTAIDNANRLMQVPLDVLASGPAIALFPTLSLLSAEGKMDEFRVQLTAAFRRGLLLTILATGLLMALRFPIIHLLLEHGQFDKDDTKFTSLVLLCYSVGMVGLAAQRLLARGFYALQDTRTPIIIGLGGMTVFSVLGALLVFVKPMGAPGLALAATVAISTLALWMWSSLRSKLGGWDGGASVAVLWKSCLAAVAAYCAAWLIAHFGIQWITAHGYDSPTTPSLIKMVARAAVTMTGVVLGVTAFVLVAAVLRVPELEALTRKWDKLRRSR